MENNEIVKALGMLPEMIQSNKQVIESNTRLQSLYAESLKRRIKATVPDEERSRLVSEISSAISHTRCATPDMSDVAHEIAGEVRKDMTSTVRSVVREAAKDAVKETPLRVEHLHTHTTLRYAYEFSEGHVHNLLIILSVICALLLISGSILCYEYFNSPAYIGQQYCDICFSKYTTEDECKMLMADCYSVSFVPKDFDRNRKLVKEKIRRNKSVLKQRQYEAERNKGKWKTQTPLKR